MKFLPAEPDFEEGISNRLVSENGHVQICVYQVAYGYRVRAGFTLRLAYELDWCGGSDWQNVERLYSLCLAILSKREETRDCFKRLPPQSHVKPFHLDHEFVKIVCEAAGDFSLVSLVKPSDSAIVTELKQRKIL